MKSKKTLIGFVALLLVGVALWLLILRPLTNEQRLIQFLRSQFAEQSGYQIDAAHAAWSLLSPFDMLFEDLSIEGPAMGETALSLDSLHVSLSPKFLRDGARVTSLGFSGARLYRRDDPALGRAGNGLSGTLWHPRGARPGAVWRLEFQGTQIHAQPILAFLGSPFEMHAQLELSGEFIASGEKAYSLQDSLVGQVSLRGGPGSLDARAMDSLNRGVVRWARDSGHFVDWPDVIDFRHLVARFDVKSGLRETAFSLEFENMSLNGTGALDIFASQINYDFKLRFSSEADDHAFRAGEYVADTPWPIRCEGSFAESLPCRLDREAVFDLALQLIREDAQNALNNLFGDPE